jgi:biopolymer transport protein TolR
MPVETRPSAEPNVTPMIDVLLVLLIVFMVAVVEGRRTMDVQLPVPCVGTCAAGDAIVLEVLPGGVYRLNRGAVAHDELKQRLANVYADRPSKVIAVAGRPGAKYAEVMEAMDVARAAGVRVISIVPKGL